MRVRIGQTFDIPRVCEGVFSSDAVEKDLRSERALRAVLVEMYIQGVTTRKLGAIMKSLDRDAP
jgi:transposase-like protein